MRSMGGRSSTCIADVACRIPPGSPLDAGPATGGVGLLRSLPPENMEGGSSIQCCRPSWPDELSLNQDVDRHSVTLWLTIEDARRKREHERTLIRNRDKTTYDAMRRRQKGPSGN